MPNTIMDRLQNNESSRQVFAPVLNNNAYAAKFNSQYGAGKGKDIGPIDEYKHDLKNKHSMSYKLTLAGIVALVLGGVGIVGGRENLRKAVLKGVTDINYKKFHKIPLNIVDYFKTGTKWLFNGDKIKDFSFLRVFNAIPLVGPMFVKASKSTSWFLKKIHVERQWKELAKQADELKGIVDEKILKKIKAMAQPDNLNKRLNEHKTVIKKQLTNKFDEKYFPQGKIWRKEFWTSLWKGGEKAWKDIKAEGDLIMSKWGNGKDKKLANTLKDTIDDTAGIAALKNNSNEKVKQFLTKYEEVRNIEVDKYAARVRDLELGGGVPEFLIPTVAGALLYKNTAKGQTHEERVDKFIKGGGVAIVGGLGAWVVTSLIIGLSGPTGLLAGLVSGIVLDSAGRIVNKKMKKVRQQIRQQGTN